MVSSHAPPSGSALVQFVGNSVLVEDVSVT